MAKDRVSLRGIIEALERGAASPEIQKRAAEILFKSIDSKGIPKRLTIRERGRPRRLVRRTFDREQLVDTVDWIAHALWQKGSNNPTTDALEEAAKLENITFDTIQKYYREGVKKLSARDSKFALEIDDLMANAVGKEKGVDVDCLLDSAIHQIVGNYPGADFVARRQYERGKLAMAVKGKNPERK